MARRQVPPTAAVPDPLTEHVNGHRAAKRGRAEQEVAARGELAVREAARPLLPPKSDASVVELADHEAADRMRHVERRFAVERVDAARELVDLVLVDDRRLRSAGQADFTGAQR